MAARLPSLNKTPFVLDGRPLQEATSPHAKVKNEFGGGHVPSQRFGVNSAWFKIALLTYNLVSAIKGLCLGEEERIARMKMWPGG